MARWLDMYARVALAALALLIAVGAPGRADAQAEMTQWLNPEFGKAMGRADYRFTLFPDAAVEKQSTDFGYEQQNITLAVPLYQDLRNEWSLTARGRYQDFSTHAVFPLSGRAFPEELWDIRAGTTFRHKFDNDWIGGVSLTIGSASDKPFDSEDELLVQAIAFLRVPHRERNAWFFTLIYTNDQEFLSGIPIPGIAYQWVPSDTFNAVIGVPFSAVEWKPIEPLTFESSYFPVRHVRARATWRIFRPLRAYVGFDWDNERYMLADRSDHDDRLYYYEKRLTAGARFDLKHVGIEVYGGYVFDRFYFLGDGYSDRRKDRFDVEAGPFVGVRIGVRWWPGGGP
jgi:hypothetical protein